MQASVVAHCDWSLDGQKRFMTVATHIGERFHVSVPEPVGDTANLVERLQARARTQGPLLLGFDFPIGLPRIYGERTGFSSFRALMGELGTGRWADWFKVATEREEISLARPFYPARPGGTLRRHLFEALDMQGADLLRLCEQPGEGRQTPAMLFWTLGGNQVGKAAITGWREVIMPNRARTGLWPFDGALKDLLERHAVVMAETYPGDAYGQIGIPRRPVWSKRRQEGRLSVAPFLQGWIVSRPYVEAEALLPVIADGFGADKFGEDRFDCVVGLFAMLDVLTRKRPEGAPDRPDVRLWEGWILGRL